MKKSMGLLMMLWILLGSNLAYSKCQLITKQKITSLSAPISYLLEELDLHQSKNLIGVSTFHHINNLKPHTKRVPGGLFIAQKNAEIFKGSVVFFDRSRELKNNLEKKFKFKKLVEVVTAGGTISVTKLSLNILRDYIKGCDKKLKLIKTRLDNLEIKKFKKYSRTVIFHLSKLTNSMRLPKLLMVNDGPIQFWASRNIFNTYPSDLAYATISEKVLNTIKGDVLHIGLVDDKDAINPKVVKVSKNRWNLHYRGIFSPGLSHLNLIDKLDWNKYL